MAKREISTTLKLEGEQEFNRQMDSSKNALSNLKSEMAVVTSEFADNAKSTEALTAKQKLLADQVEQQRSRVAALTKFLEDNADAFDENTEKGDKYQRMLNSAKVELNKMEGQLEDTTAELRKSKTIKDTVARSVEKLKDSYEDFAKSHPRVVNGLNLVNSASRTAGKGLQDAAVAAGALSAAGGAAVAVLGALSAVGVAKMAQFAKEAAEAGEEGFGQLATNLSVLDKATASAKNALGGVLLPTLEELSADGTVMLKKFSEEIEAAGQDPQKLSAAFSSLIRNAVTEIRRELPQMAELGMSLVESIADGALESTPEMFDMAQEVLNVFLDGLDENADMLADGAVMLITELVNFLGENSPDLLIAAVEILSALTTALAENAPQLVPAAVQLVTGLLVALVQNAPLLISSGAEMIGSILIGLLNELPNLVKFVPEMHQMIQDAVDKSVMAMWNVGVKIIETILAGLKSAWASVTDWFSNAVANLRGTANVTIKTDGSHAGGLNYVPYDGYIAELHRGEMVVPANEAQVLRAGNFKGAGAATTINIYTQTLSEAQIDYLYKRFNAELGASI